LPVIPRHPIDTHCAVIDSSRWSADTPSFVSPPCRSIQVIALKIDKLNKFTNIFIDIGCLCIFLHVVDSNTQFMPSFLCLVLDPMSSAVSEAAQATDDQF